MKKIFLCLVILQISILFISLEVSAQNQTDLWGMTRAGGDGYGVIFKTDSNGENIETQYSFGENPGKSPQYTHLCEAANGKLYGMTANGGVGNAGILFEYDPSNGVYTKKFDFSGGLNGSNPNGSLVLASDGKLYGMTKTGGENSNGVLFSYNPVTELFTKLLDFEAVANGYDSRGSLIQASDGKLYGMTGLGGAYDKGVLFSFNIVTGTFAKEMDFAGSSNGSNPVGSLMQASNGKLYGMTNTGGVNDLGVLFEYDPVTTIYSLKLEFAGTTNGSNPEGSLLEVGGGLFYGMTVTGGTSDLGVLFNFDPATGIYTKKLDFDGTTNGSNPHGSLIEASSGLLFGLTQTGGSDSQGILFEYNRVTNILTNKLNFAGSSNGRNPIGSLMLASNDKLYGMTVAGGATGNGVLFDFDPDSGLYNKIIDFTITTNGSYPQGSLMTASNGMLYGLTVSGGAGNNGVIFEYNPVTGVYSKKFDFDGALHGSNPVGSLVEAANGLLYGLTLYGGANNSGVLFEYDPETNTCTKKIDFAGSANGSYPNGSLMLAANGNLYGMTQQGGTSNYGVLFEYDPLTNTYVKKINFAGSTNGRNPCGSLIQTADGKLYGLTAFGGTSNVGVLFEFNPAISSYSKLLDFTGTATGSYPYGSLVLASNGKLYGMTSQGGANSYGVLFEYDLSGTYTKHIDFDGTNNGSGSRGNLMQASNGKLYGMTYQGGESNNGVLFEFNIVTNTLVKKTDFNLINGQNPMYTNLIELCAQPEFVDIVANVNICQGGNASFVCSATGNGLSYQWLVDDGSGFDIITDNSMYSGSISSTLDVTGITVDMDNYQYKCVVTSTCPVMDKESNVATLTLNEPYSYYENHSICEGEVYTWHGVDYTESNTYTANYTSQYGCDSTYTLTLTVNPVYSFEENHSICEGETYTWHGTDYTEANTYTASYLSINGCDSIYTLTLTVNPVYSFEENHSICEGEVYTWHGADYTDANTYTANYTSQYGCDSIYTLNLTVNPVYSFEENHSICAGEIYTWHGADYTDANTYTANYTSHYGCDSIYTLNLTVNPVYSFEESHSICEGEVYTWHGVDYTVANTYTAGYTSEYGCDSVYTLDLTVFELPELSITGLDTQYCNNAPSVQLTGNPAGGIFSGTGVSGTEFNPAIAGPGNLEIVYTYSDGNNCENSVSVFVQVDDCSGIKTEMSGNIQIYPNPNSGEFKIVLTESGNYRLAIYNSIGQIVWSANNPISGISDISVQDLLPGAYILTVEKDDIVNQLKLIVK